MRSDSLPRAQEIAPVDDDVEFRWAGFRSFDREQEALPVG